MNNTNIKVVAYVRATSSEQADCTIQAQLKELRAYAEKNNLEIIKEFVDIGSAYSKRKGFEDMLFFLNHCEEDCKTILVEKVERLTKWMQDFELIDENINIHTSRSGLIANRRIACMRMVASLYSDNLSEAIKRGLQIKKERQAARKLEEETRKEVNNVK